MSPFSILVQMHRQIVRELEIILQLYRGIIRARDKDGIPIQLRSLVTPNAVQDDAFQHWIETEIKLALPREFEIHHSGHLTTPDIVIRNPVGGTMVGLEIKKLVQQSNGSDSRGLTIDYNSCLPCGTALVKVGNDTVEIPCYYLFALMNKTGTHILTLIIVDGDFLNYDFELHKEAKFANYSEYDHGPYAEGSVRHRRMYTYPNPLNTKIQALYQRMAVIGKRSEFERIGDMTCKTQMVRRVDKYGNEFQYLIHDNGATGNLQGLNLPVVEGIFDSCKNRVAKDRTPALPHLPELKK